MKIFLILLNTKVAIYASHGNTNTEILLNAGNMLICYGWRSKNLINAT